MNKVTKEQYEFALARVEELLPLVDDNTPSNDKNAVELTVMSDIVIKRTLSDRKTDRCGIDRAIP